MTGQWMLASPPPTPTVYARIKTKEWEMTTETSHMNATLEVFQNSLLILVCMAGYPVVWRKDNEKASISTEHANFSSPSKYEIPAIRGYEAKLQIKKFDQSAAGIYTCQSENISSNLLRAEITLKVRPKPKAGKSAEILQGSFDHFDLQPIVYYLNRATKLEIPFIWYAPPGAAVSHVLVAADSDIEWSLEQPNSENNSTTLYIQGWSVNPDYPCLQLEAKLLSPVHGKTVVMVAPGWYTQNGDAQFILRTTLPDGTTIERRSRFHLKMDHVEDARVEHAVGAPSPNATVSLTIGRMYELRMYAKLISARLQLFQQAQHVNGSTGRTKVEASNAYDVCGIIGVSLVNDSSILVGQETGVKVSILVKRACVLKLLYNGRDESDHRVATLYIITTMNSPKTHELAGSPGAEESGSEPGTDESGLPESLDPHATVTGKPHSGPSVSVAVTDKPGTATTEKPGATVTGKRRTTAATDRPGSSVKPVSDEEPSTESGGVD